MKKTSILRKLFYGSIALPLNIIAEVLSYLYLIHIRASESGKRKHIKLEALEKGKYIKRIK